MPGEGEGSSDALSNVGWLGLLILDISSGQRLCASFKDVSFSWRVLGGDVIY